MSSQQTLEKIAELDNVNNNYRYSYLSKRQFYGALVGAGSLGTTAILTNKIIENGFDLLGVTFGGLGLITLGAGAYDLFTATKTKREYKKEIDSKNTFYYFDGKVSHKETAVERAYGEEIVIANSLDEMDYYTRKDSYEPQCKFIDHLILRNLKRSERVDSEYSDCPDDPGYFDVTYYEGEFDIERFGNKKKFEFSFKDKMPMEYATLLATENKEIALLFKTTESEFDDSLECDPIKVYNPHP